MTDSKRAFYFVVGVLGFLAYGYVHYASGWLPSAPQKQSLWDRAGKIAEQVVTEIEKEVESDSSESESTDDPIEPSDVPDADQAYMIAAPPVAALVASISANNFNGFYYIISKDWQTRAGRSEYLQGVTYSDLFDQQPKFSGLTGFEITEPPEMLDDQTLLINGRAESGQETFSFQLSAIQEEGEWKATDLTITLDR